MKSRELARLFYREMLKTTLLVNPPQYALQIAELYNTLIKIAFEATREEGVPFNTLFSRFIFIAQKFQIPNSKQFYLHEFRKKAEMLLSLPTEEQPIIAKLGFRVVADFIKILFQEDPPNELDIHLPKGNFYKKQPAEIAARLAALRVLVVGEDSERKILYARAESFPSEELVIRYDLAERNDNFKASIEALKNIFGFPTNIQLLDIERDTEGCLRPRVFIIEPDYLLDVTTVAECFRSSGAEPFTALLKKFSIREESPALAVGNIANFFLDELIANPDADFRNTFKKNFRLNPLTFALLEDDIIKKIYEDSKKHFACIKRMVNGDFQKHGISPQDVFIEPSFLSEIYGLQGRLDVFYKSPKAAVASIIELKSGKPFQENSYGLSHNHFVQTLLYDLLIKHAFDGKIESTNYILYSVLDDENLKYAPPIKAQQHEAINVRNQILAIEQAVINLNRVSFSEHNIFTKMIQILSKTAKGFEGSMLTNFCKIWDSLSECEKHYFVGFASFVAREHQLAKVGIQGSFDANGMAAFWLESPLAKEENFEILSHLQIKENFSRNLDAILVLEFTDKTPKLANFRVGDIAILYPTPTSTEVGKSPTQNQIFKGSLIELTPTTLRFRMRSHQQNQILFETTPFWNIEHDFLDSSFNAQYRGLVELMRCPHRKRNLLLTLEAPRNTPLSKLPNMPTELTPEQQEIFKKVIAAKDYFLLWGPPGTGKTSMMLYHLVKWWLQNTNENILLLAYTNRAVDEICESIEKIGGTIRADYFRIGSRFSTDERFHEQLLDKKIENIDNRKDLKTLIEGHRIVVATVASMAGKTEIFKLIKIHRAVVDEASQVLEPSLVGILPKVETFILIGDHRQLPAVVTQNERESAIKNDPLLANIGLTNYRNSLFERLYKRANQQNWEHAYSILTKQGRMHQDIMKFPSIFFYDSKLDVLPNSERQIKPLLNLQNQENQIDELEKLVLSKRFAFIDTKPEPHSKGSKTNEYEANTIVKLVQLFSKHYALSDIGIITPFRAQIATIRHALQNQMIDPDDLTIDTVERYQGGAREVILISLCTNSEAQVRTFTSLSDEGIDRKLNVALTRAREHLVIVGNDQLLRGIEVYKNLLDFLKNN